MEVLVRAIHDRSNRHVRRLRFLSRLSVAAAACTGMALASRDAVAQPTDRSGTPAPSAVSAPPAATRPMAIVHIDAPQAVTLEARNEDDEWETVCSSPCDKQVSATGSYRVAGPGIRDSNTFRLDTASPLTLHVAPSSSGGHAMAIVLTVVGGLGLVPAAGITVIIVGGEILGAILLCPIATAFVSKDQQNAEYGNCLGSIATFFGQGYAQPYVWGPAIAGAALLTAGIVWLVKTPHTGVTQTANAATLLPRPTPLSPTPGHYEAVSLLSLPPPPVVSLVDS